MRWPRHKPAVDALHCALAAKHGVHILGASGPVFLADRPVNRATFYGPDGIIGHQDKQIMTRFERETWDVVAGQGLPLFDTPLGKIGVVICYDSEFPLAGPRDGRGRGRDFAGPVLHRQHSQALPACGSAAWRGLWKTNVWLCIARPWAFAISALPWMKI